VEWQFRVAAGDPLPLTQEQIPLRGHAVEARLYAEDPERGFVPSTGRLVALEFPQGDGLRVDSGVAAGMQVTPFYDPMIAKLIAQGETRVQALDRLARALDETVVAGPRTNAAFLAALCRAELFRRGEFDTGFIDRNLAALGAVPREPDRAAVAKGVAELLAREAKRIAARVRSASEEADSPWNSVDAFQLCGARAVSIPVSINGAPATASVSRGPQGTAVCVDGVPAAPDGLTFAAGGAVYVLRHGRQTVVRIQDVEAIDVDHLDTGGLIAAPMHGKVLAILVRPGASVSKGQRLAVIEAMKMEHALIAPFDGTVAEISATPGGQVAEGAKVMTIEARKPEPV
jgi:3-methylcrotonyl-CoA carboxylase alpha subunit